VLLLAGCPGPAQETKSPPSELKFTLIFSRHGVRSPIWTNEQLDQYSAEPWPKWDVPPGYLTPHGEKLMRLFGAYDRAYFVRAGLLSANGCSEAGQVFFSADTDERTIHTARALAAGMLPGCPVVVHSQLKWTHDALFSPFEAGIAPPDRRLAVAATLGRIGNNPAALEDLYRPALETLERVLLGCPAGTPCPPGGKASKKSLFREPTSIAPGQGDHLAVMNGPLQTAGTISESFRLEYTNGMAGRNLGWGRVDESSLRELLSLHAAQANLMWQTPALARPLASNLLSHILKTMEQAVTGRAVPGALGKPGDRVAVVVGHDTNISNMAGALGISWLIQGLPWSDTPPGGALVFEVWREPSSGEYSVRTYFVCQTLDQMRRALPLTLDSPPARAPIFVPACGTTREGFACDWVTFRSAVEGAIEPAFVKP